MTAKMTAFYSENKPVAKELVEGRLYGLVVKDEVLRWEGADYTEGIWLLKQDWVKNNEIKMSAVSIDVFLEVGKTF